MGRLHALQGHLVRPVPPLLAALALLPAQAEMPRASVPAESEWVRELPGGVTVELLGVSDPEVDPDVWWTPDGKSLAAPVTNATSDGRTKAAAQVRAFTVRVRGPSDDDLDVHWDFGRYFGGRSGTGTRDGRPVRGVEFAVVELPADAATWTIRLEVAAARWVTAATRTSDGQGQPRPEGRSVIFTQPHAISEGTAIVVVEDYPDRQDARVVALDRDGRPLASSFTGRGMQTKDFRVHDASLRGIKPDEVERYALQFRPIEAVEFRDVPLAAPKP
jgi:hypothetical protein